MPERAALIAALIIERPLCLECIATKSGMTAMSVKGYLERMAKLVTVHWVNPDRCHACGIVGNVVLISRAD